MVSLCARARSSPKAAAVLLAAVKLAVHALTLRPYGFFRDELYYIACGEHLAWGYVDQPPFCVVALRLWRAVFGDSLAALRMLPALVGAATVLVAGFIAIELGGRFLAAALTGLAVLTAGQYLGTAHYYSMNVWDQFFWTLATWLVLRAVERNRARDWIALGLALGIALENKASVLWLCAAIGAGLVATPARAALRTRWPYVAAAIAGALVVPYLLWEIRHGWPTLEFMRNAMPQKYVARPFGAFLREQIEQNNPFTLPLWLAGLVALLSRRLGARAAALGWIYLAAFAIVASEPTSKPEYLSPAYPMLMAAGAVWWERWLASLASGAHAWLRPAAAAVLAVAMLAGGLLSAPFALAVLPEERFIAYERALGKKPESSERRELGELTQFYADMHGWPELTDLVARVFDSLAPGEKPGATIWTRSGGYGSAAAIDFFGRGRSLPHAICGHNNYWLWGHGKGDGRAVIIVGGRPDRIARYFATFERVATFECRYCRPDENHKPIYLGRRMNTSFAAIWPAERYFD
jgi:hypothetical protein